MCPGGNYFLYNGQSTKVTDDYDDTVFYYHTKNPPPHTDIPDRSFQTAAEQHLWQVTCGIRCRPNSTTEPHIYSVSDILGLRLQTSRPQNLPYCTALHCREMTWFGKRAERQNYTGDYGPFLLQHFELGTVCLCCIFSHYSPSHLQQQDTDCLLLKLENPILCKGGLGEADVWQAVIISPDVPANQPNMTPKPSSSTNTTL